VKWYSLSCFFVFRRIYQLISRGDTLTEKAKKEKAIYLQLAELLENKIINKKYRSGSAIPSERELCKTYGISRMTVRKGIDHLVEKGILTRVQGKGTFVSRIDINSPLDGLESMRSFIREEGLLPSSKVLRSVSRTAGEKYARIFSIHPDDIIFELYRLRLADGRPIAMEYTYVPMYLIPDIDSHDFEKESLYELFETNGLQLGTDEQTLEIVRVTSPQSNLLRIPDDSAVFMLNNTVTDIQDRVIEHTHSYINQNYMSFSARLT